jgi:hypothetical protein
MLVTGRKKSNSLTTISVSKTFVFLCLLENKAAFVLAGSIIHGAMRCLHPRCKRNHDQDGKDDKTATGEDFLEAMQPHLARKRLAFSVGINRERNGSLAFVFLCPLENKAAFVLAGSIIHGAMRLSPLPDEAIGKPHP